MTTTNPRKLPRLRHIWRGLAMNGPIHYLNGREGWRSWPERWVVYIVERYDYGYRPKFHLYAELRGTCRPWVWHHERGWLAPRLLKGPPGVFITPREFDSLATAREDGRRRAQVLMFDHWVERRLDANGKGKTVPSEKLIQVTPETPLEWVWRKNRVPVDSP
jgi:hypothetical protein